MVDFRYWLILDFHSLIFLYINLLYVHCTKFTAFYQTQIAIFSVHRCLRKTNVMIFHSKILHCNQRCFFMLQGNIARTMRKKSRFIRLTVVCE